MICDIIEYLSWILPGLKCYNQEPDQPAGVLDCDDLGGANYCAKVTGPSGTARTCGFEVVMDAFRPLGLTSAGCTTVVGYKFCLCTEDKCNWRIPGTWKKHNFKKSSFPMLYNITIVNLVSTSSTLTTSFCMLSRFIIATFKNVIVLYVNVTNTKVSILEL